jgi:hypothetical protein
MDVSGTLVHPSDKVADITLPLISVSGSLLFGNSITSGLSFFPQVSASGYTGSVGTGSNTLTLLEVVSFSGGSYIGQASIVLPLFTMGDTQQAVSITVGPFSAYSLNTENFGVSSFSNFIFDSFAEFNGLYLASSPSGLFLLSGNNDIGTKIDVVIKKEQFGGDVRNKKRVRNIYTELRTDGDYEIDVKIDNDTYTYIAEPTHNYSDGIQTVRTKPGKGLLGRYITMLLRNTNGNNIEVRELGLDIEMSERSGRL